MHIQEMGEIFGFFKGALKQRRESVKSFFDSFLEPIGMHLACNTVYNWLRDASGVHLGVNAGHLDKLDSTSVLGVALLCEGRFIGKWDFEMLRVGVIF